MPSLNADRPQASGLWPFHQRLGFSSIHRNATQDALETFECITENQSAICDLELADRILMRARALLDDRNGSADPALGFEIAQQDHAVGEIGDVNGCPHIAD